MSKNFPALFEALPRINATINVLAPQGITKEGLFNIIFPNAEDLFATRFWPKFFEKYLMKSPFSPFKGLNVKFMPELKNLLPSPLPFKSGRSR